MIPRSSTWSLASTSAAVPSPAATDAQASATSARRSAGSSPAPLIATSAGAVTRRVYGELPRSRTRTSRMLEATGGPAACVRCGRPAPAHDDPAWGARFHNGRLIALACPACLTAGERSEIGGRGEAHLWEVVPARRATAGDLRGHVDPAWLARLDADVPVVGLVVGEPDAGGLEVLWIGSAPGGIPLAVRALIGVATWAALEEVFVPGRARALAAGYLA